MARAVISRTNRHLSKSASGMTTLSANSISLRISYRSSRSSPMSVSWSSGSALVSRGWVYAPMSTAHTLMAFHPFFHRHRSLGAFCGEVMRWCGDRLTVLCNARDRGDRVKGWFHASGPLIISANIIAAIAVTMHKPAISAVSYKMRFMMPPQYPRPAGELQHQG